MTTGATMGPAVAPIALLCPRCRQDCGALDTATDQAIHCACGYTIASVNGVWRALSPERELHFRTFMKEYREIRLSEGRGSRDPEYYFALPFEDLSGKNAWQWQIRAKTYDCFARKVLPEMEARVRRPIEILDIGAGNGWLSYRLAGRGHRPVAVDLLDDEFDGLQATRHYAGRLEHPFPAMQAEMDRLPFADGQFDAAIFNAAFHYSEDYGRTIAEALHCLRKDADIVILDTPCYGRAESGEAMLRERHDQYQQRYGFASNSVASREYVTMEMMHGLERQFGFKWRVLRPWYGWNWAMRPWKARWANKREPSNFYIFWGRTQA
jgi:SAM-dependent methyltransferase